MTPLKVALVGCGNIAQRYVDWLQPLDQIELVGAFDLRADRAQELAAKFDGSAYPTIDALLADDDVEAVVNLTIEREHVGVTTRCLEAGKHVYTEKPIALSSSEARGLVDLAKRQDVLLGSAPSLWLSTPEQTAWKMIRDGVIGDVKVVYCDLNWGRIEAWHPEPAPYYEVGPLWNVAIYALATMTALFGPVRRVTGHGSIVDPERSTKAGDTFTVTAPDFFFAIVELANGTIVRLTTNFYVAFHSARLQFSEFHGDLGSLWYADDHDKDPRVELALTGQPYERVPLLERPFELSGWAAGLLDLAEAVRDGRPPRTGAEHAAHLVDVFEALTRSSEEGCAVEVGSSFPPPPPMDWA